jgi:hypothetical protein
VRLARALVALLLAFVVGALVTLFVDPGYPVYPNALVPAVVLGVLLCRSSARIALLALEIDAVRGEGSVEIQVQNGVALLTAQCPACAS